MYVQRCLQLVRKKKHNTYFLTGYVAGGIFVNLAAKKFMQSIYRFRVKHNCKELNSSYTTGRLQGTEWDSPQSIDLAVNNFERNAKRKVITKFYLQFSDRVS